MASWRIDTLEAIAGLVDQSLVRRTANAGETRFGMLETIREYGRERLEADGGALQIGRRHIVYFKDLGQAGEQHLLGPDQVRWLDRFEREHDNVRAALRRAVDTGETDDALLLARVRAGGSGSSAATCAKVARGWSS